MKIASFTGQYRFLSNFYPLDPFIRFEGYYYPTVEHAYQAAKTQSDVERQRIAALPTPGQAKRAGRRVELRPDWEQCKLRVMEILLRHKFQDPELAAKLVATHPHVLIEGNTWGDRFWGVSGGGGENHLGNLLMRLRQELVDSEGGLSVFVC